MEFEKFLNFLFKHKVHLYFVSPHLDDAALSCGGLIQYLSKHFLVTVVSVFAGKPSPPFSISGKAFLKQCKNDNAESLFEQRRLEDKKIFKKLGINAEHFDFTDALWRKKEKPDLFSKLLGGFFSEAFHIYPTYRWHVISGKTKNENVLVKSIKESLKQVIDTDKNYLIFCPAGIGNHVDHIITRNCCLETFEKVVLWSDFPYCEKEKNLMLGNEGLEELVFYFDNEKKKRMVQAYESQYEAMFPEGVNFLEEKYYFKKEALKINI